MREQIQREQLQHHQQGMEAKLSALSSVGLNNCRADKVRTTIIWSVSILSLFQLFSIANFFHKAVDHKACSALPVSKKLSMKVEHGDFDIAVDS